MSEHVRCPRGMIYPPVADVEEVPAAATRADPTRPTTPHARPVGQVNGTSPTPCP
jgi:hypothetical protein